jgi:hypothetical protein
VSSTGYHDSIHSLRISGSRVRLLTAGWYLHTLRQFDLCNLPELKFNGILTFPSWAGIAALDGERFVAAQDAPPLRVFEVCAAPGAP